MNFDLRLRNLPELRLSNHLINEAVAVLRKIKNRNEQRSNLETSSKVFENRKEKVRKQLQKATDPKNQIEKIVKNVVGGRRLLLSIYIESYGQAWLPAFDQEIAEHLLGKDPSAWRLSIRRLAVTLFFERFDLLDAVNELASRIRTVLKNESDTLEGKWQVWAQKKDIIFQSDGHVAVIKNIENGQSLKALMEQYAIPARGRFAEKLRQDYFLETLQRCKLGDEPNVLNEIKSNREEITIDALPIGAAALRVLVRRVQSEADSKWPENWRKWIIPLGCDPRMGRHNKEVAKWWGWATETELRLAIQGIVGLSLKFFFDFLDGTVTVEQWRERRKFLEACFNSGKIIDARLVLNNQCLSRLPPEMKDIWTTASLNMTAENTCIIALRCTDDVYLLEGTHNFGLRAFHGRFPVDGFWERSRDKYNDHELRISPSDSPVYIPHLGHWRINFLHQLRNQFHVEWNLRRL